MLYAPTSGQKPNAHVPSKLIRSPIGVSRVHRRHADTPEHRYLFFAIAACAAARRAIGNRNGLQLT